MHYRLPHSCQHASKNFANRFVPAHRISEPDQCETEAAPAASGCSGNTATIAPGTDVFAALQQLLLVPADAVSTEHGLGSPRRCVEAVMQLLLRLAIAAQPGGELHAAPTAHADIINRMCKRPRCAGPWIISSDDVSTSLADFQADIAHAQRRRSPEDERSGT